MMRGKYILLAAALFFSLQGTGLRHFAYADKLPPKAAFIRDGNLWLKTEKGERQLTSLSHAADPVWSADGQWILYAAGNDTFSSIRVVHPASGQEKDICGDCYSAQWSPVQTELAYIKDGVLYAVQVEEGQTAPQKITEDVGQFGWLPDGTGFLTASRPELIDGKWEPIELRQVKLRPSSTKGGKVSVHHFYTLPEMSNDFMAVGLSQLKWSPDGKWAAFIAAPTASLSMDSNTLCVLSSEGEHFFMLDKMLFRTDWFKWAPIRIRLGYIEGEGRFEISNKHWKMKDLPLLVEPPFTPRGMMDLGFIWVGDVEVIVSRSPELKWVTGPVPQAKPSLYRMNTGSKRSVRLTYPLAGQGDFAPSYFEDTGLLTWIRKDAAAKRNDVWISEADGTKARLYIKNVDDSPSWQ